MQSAARHSGKNAIIICLAPDVCETQVGGSAVPIPYMIISRLDWSDRKIHARLGEIFGQLRRVPLSAGLFLSSKRRMQFFGLWFAPFLTEWILKKAKHL